MKRTRTLQRKLTLRRESLVRLDAKTWLEEVRVQGASGGQETGCRTTAPTTNGECPPPP